MSSFQEGSEADSPTEEIKLGAIGSTMVKTAQLVTKGLEAGAEKATTLIEYASEKQKAKSEAAATDVKVSPALKYTATGAKYATKATVKVSGFVASRVGKLSKGMADYLAKKVEKPVVGVTGGSGGGSGSMKKSTTKENIVDAARYVPIPNFSSDIYCLTVLTHLEFQYLLLQGWNLCVCHYL